MGRLDPGLVATLLFLIPGMWHSNVLTSVMYLCGQFLWEHGHMVMFTKAGFEVGVPWLLFWLFLLGFLHSSFWNGGGSSKKKWTGSRHQKVQHFRRRKLAYFMVLTCRERLFSFPPITFADGFQVKADQLGLSRQYTPKDRQHRRWRRVQVKSKHRAWKRRVLQHEGFLTVRRSSVQLWNQHPVADMEFLAAPNTDSFLPHAEFGVVPEDVLTKFVEDRASTFLAAARLKSKLESADRSRVAEEVVQRANIFTSTYQTKCKDTGKRRHTFKTCPLVWDTGASAGLTPFRCNLSTTWSARYQ